MAKSRSGAVKLNFVTGIIHELIVVIIGLLVPRITLSYFGSDYNGLLNSIVQFMSFSVVFRSGLGAVTNAALYKPIAEGDTKKISGIMVATNRFMIRVGWLLAAVIVGFAAVYPLLVLDEFSYIFTFALILIVGMASWVENMFSIKYKILLQADQKYYIVTIVTVIAYVLSNVFAVLLMVAGFGIHIVRIGTLLGLMTTPFMLKLYVERRYTIDWSEESNDSAIKSRWDAFAQQIAMVANNNVPTVLMTFLFPLKEISVYTVYYMVVKNINQLMSSAFAGMRSTFGNMYAKGEKLRLKESFADVEWMIFAGGAVLYGITGALLTPFVEVYTRGITDVNYSRYWFGILMVLSCFIYTTRLPYQLMVEAVGRFKETRNSAIMETVVNVIVSLICASFIGLNGILVGSLAGGVVRVVNLIWICNKKVLDASMVSVIKNYFLYCGTGIALAVLLPKIMPVSCEGFGAWIIFAIPVALIVSVVIVCISLAFNRKQLAGTLKRVIRRR